MIHGHVSLITGAYFELVLSGRLEINAPFTVNSSNKKSPTGGDG
ncbi:hypothetical protein ABEKA_0589 [Acinetobacter lwoffii]|nr:hypothetical protein ABEKA_0589 [Acinetobacter lwoffii]